MDQRIILSPLPLSHESGPQYRGMIDTTELYFVICISRRHHQNDHSTRLRPERSKLRGRYILQPSKLCWHTGFVYHVRAASELHGKNRVGHYTYVVNVLIWYYNVWLIGIVQGKGSNVKCQVKRGELILVGECGLIIKLHGHCCCSPQLRRRV